MRLDVKGLAIGGAIFWGACMFLVALFDLISPPYGRAFLDAIASIYPGYTPGGFGSVVLVTVYALIDGAIGGALLAWLYNLTQRPAAAQAQP